MPGEIDIRPLAAEDAAKLTDCFECCYGDSYVVGFFCMILSEYAVIDDVLRLQRPAVESATLPELVFAEARGILDAALADRTPRPPRVTSS